MIYVVHLLSAVNKLLQEA